MTRDNGGPEGPDASPGSTDRALGAVYGALAGDAAGAVLEFLGRPPSESEVKRALTFPGGGTYGVAPGQVTDDGELAICQLRGLVAAPGDPLAAIAMSYADWIRSQPFDVGFATSTGLAPGRTHTPEADATKLPGAMRAAAVANVASKANGSLMRSSPLGVWGARRGEREIVALARADSSLTHPNPACTDAVACYALAIAHLIANAGDRKGAFQRAERWASTTGDSEVALWLDDAKAGRRPAFQPMEGFVRIGFTEAFRHLLLGSDWLAAVRETLLGGGDTDTNACIVGGMIAAADGRAAMGPRPVAALNDADTAAGRERPEWLHPRVVEGQVKSLMA